MNKINSVVLSIVVFAASFSLSYFLKTQDTTGEHLTAAVVNSTEDTKLITLLQTVSELESTVSKLPEKNPISLSSSQATLTFDGGKTLLVGGTVDFGKEASMKLVVDPQGNEILFKELTGLTSGFTYAGGSYPGRGGTCGIRITNECSIVISFKPVTSNGRELGVGQLRYSTELMLKYTVNGSLKQTNPVVAGAYSPLPASVTLRSVPYTLTFEVGTANPVSFDMTVTGTISDYSFNKVDAPFSFDKIECKAVAGTFYDESNKISTCVATFNFTPKETGTFVLPLVFDYFDNEKKTQVSQKILFKAYSGSDLTLTPEKNLLIVYNDKSTDGKTVMDYYKTNRPGFDRANILAISFPYEGCTKACGTPNDEIATVPVYERSIEKPITDWINAHPEKDIRHVVLVRGIPTRVYLLDPPKVVYSFGGPIWTNSIQHELATIYKEVPKPCERNQFAFPTILIVGAEKLPDCGQKPTEDSIGYYSRAKYPGTLALFTHLDMGSLDATLRYVDKLKNMYNSMVNPSIFISAENAKKGGTTYYFEENNNVVAEKGANGKNAKDMLEKSNPKVLVDYHPFGSQYIHNAKDVKGFLTWGGNSGRGGQYTYDGTLTFTGNSNWYLIQTVESFNGQRDERGQGRFSYWFAKNAFGGTNYDNTPVGAVAHTDEPGLSGVNAPQYFSCWEKGNLFIDCAWFSRLSPMTIAIGDPWIKK